MEYRVNMVTDPILQLDLSCQVCDTISPAFDIFQNWSFFLIPIKPSVLLFLGNLVFSGCLLKLIEVKSILCLS